MKMKKIAQRGQNGETVGIAGLAARLGVHRQTIHYWLRKGWIPIRRDYRGWPVFTEEDIRRIQDWRRRTTESPTGRRIGQLLLPLLRKEEGIQALYRTFADRFREVPEIRDFFSEMAEEEGTHASVVRFLSEVIKESRELPALRRALPQEKLRALLAQVIRHRRRAHLLSLREAFQTAVEVEAAERQCWPEGLFRALARAVPHAFSHLPKYLVDGEDAHIRRLGSYANRYAR